MAWRARFLRSKVGQRIFLLFVSSSLLPISVLAVVSFYQVSGQLRAESRERVMQVNKSQAMATYERLQIAAAQLGALSVERGGGNSFGPIAPADDHFAGMTVSDAKGKSILHWGEPSPRLDISDTEKRHLLSGKPLVKVHPCSNQFGSCVAMVKPVGFARAAGMGLIIGEINPDFLWDKDKLPPGFETCVLTTTSRSALFCSDPTLTSQLPAQGRTFSGLFQWKDHDTVYDAAYRTLLLRPEFFTDSWSITVSQKQEDVLAPMQHFRKTFPLVMLLALWIVALASSIQIRRTLLPLEKLEAGAREIGAQHFDRRVDIRSGDEFEAVAASFNSMASQLGKQFHALRTINDIDEAIFASTDRETIVDAVLAHMPYLLPCNCFAITTFADSGSSGWMRFRNLKTGVIRTDASSSRMGAGDLQRLQDNPEFTTVLPSQPVPEFISSLHNAGMAWFLILPIVVDKAVFGALVCAHECTPQVSSDDIQQGRQVADQLAVAFSNVQLMEALEQQHWGTLTALARAIDAKSAWTAGHSERVTHLALSIGRAMGLPTRDLRIMHRGGLLHDIGKIGTPPSILDKAGKLEPEETRVMQDHVRIGMRILEPVPGFREALPIVAQHHERFDGLGYPEGLAGEQISLHARIFAVADCYDAMISDRPYRKGLPKERAIQIITQEAHKQFDPRVVDVFLQLCAEDEGSTNGQTAVAAQVGQHA